MNRKKYVVTVKVTNPRWEEITMWAPSKKEARAMIKENIQWSEVGWSTKWARNNCEIQRCQVSKTDPRNPIKSDPKWDNELIKPIILQVDQLNKS